MRLGSAMVLALFLPEFQTVPPEMSVFLCQRSEQTRCERFIKKGHQTAVMVVWILCYIDSS